MSVVWVNVPVAPTDDKVFILSRIYGTCLCAGTKIPEWFYVLISPFSSRELTSPPAFLVIC